ncbi:MAG: hypothetical protein KUG74_04270 [Rhodobacteraceae bacterium]|nr:hypothetical protein [Paracoccaceae bacterium]
MLTFHLGPHKTGSTFIQRRMVQNRPLFGPNFQTLDKKDPTLFTLIDALYPLQTVAEAVAATDTIQVRAKLLGRLSAGVENMLVSSENLLGPLPTRRGIFGLYPFAEITLSAMVSGLEQAGAPFQFAFYQRNYRDWLGSIYRYKFRTTPERAFAPARFQQRHGLPASWDGFLQRLEKTVPPPQLHILSFEQDRSTGNLGTALFDLAGLPREVQARFQPLEPLNVSQSKTVDPAHWKEQPKGAI